MVLTADGTEIIVLCSFASEMAEQTVTEDGEAQQQAENPLEEAGNSQSTAEAPDHAHAENLNAGMDDGEAIIDSAQVIGDESVDAENNGSSDQEASEEQENAVENPGAGTDEGNTDEVNNNIADQNVSGEGTSHEEVQDTVDKMSKDLVKLVGATVKKIADK